MTFVIKTLTSAVLALYLIDKSIAILESEYNVFKIYKITIAGSIPCQQ